MIVDHRTGSVKLSWFRTLALMLTRGEVAIFNHQKVWVKWSGGSLHILENLY
jgi:hypothetical protein